MSEQVKTMGKPSDERDELAKLEAEVAKKRIEVTGYENFGKYDESQGPLQEGEIRYDEYLQNRPKEGVIRDGSGFREAHSGQFSNQEQHSQQSSENKVFDMLKNPGEAPDLNYESMSRMDLIKKAADAMVLGDRAEVNDIRSAFESILMEEFTRDHVAGLEGKELEDEIKRLEGTDYSQASYDAELATFDEMVVKASERTLAKESAIISSQETANSESARVAEEGDENTEKEPGSEAFTVGQEVIVQRSSGNVEGGWTVRRILKDQKTGEVLYDVLSQDGKLEKTINEGDLVGYQSLKPSSDTTDGGKNGNGEKSGEAKDASEINKLEKESQQEINVGDRVQYKDRNGQLVEGKVVDIVTLDNEDYVIYKVELADGTIKSVSFVTLLQDAVPGGEGSDGSTKPGTAVEKYVPKDGGNSGKNGGNKSELEEPQIFTPEIRQEMLDALQAASDKYAEATAKHRNGFMGHLLHNSKFIAKIPVIGKLLKGAAEKLNDAQDKILLGPAREEYKQAIVAIQNEIQNEIFVEQGIGPESFEAIRVEASRVAIDADMQLEMKIMASRMDRSGDTNTFVNWWVQQKGLGGKFKKAGIIVGAGLTSGVVLGLAGAPIIIGSAVGAGIGAGVGLYATKKRAAAISSRGGAETLAEQQGREDSQRKETYGNEQIENRGGFANLEDQGGFANVADLVSTTENRTGDEKVGNRRRIKSAAGAGAIGGSAGASIGSAIRSGIENASAPTTKELAKEPDAPSQATPEAPTIDVPQPNGISILDNEGGTEAIQRLYGANQDQARAIWDQVFSQYGTNPLDHSSVGGPSMPDIIQLPSGSYGWSHEGWLSSTMTEALNKAAQSVMG